MDIKKHLYAQLLEISETRGSNKRFYKLQAFESIHLLIILDLAFNPNITFGIDVEKIKWKPSKDSEQSLVYRLKQEAKKLINLTNLGAYPNLPIQKKETVLKSILETIHPEDAQLLLCVIQKKLPFDNITREMAIEAFPYFEEKWKVPAASVSLNSNDDNEVNS